MQEYLKKCSRLDGEFAFECLESDVRWKNLNDTQFVNLQRSSEIWKGVNVYVYYGIPQNLKKFENLKQYVHPNVLTITQKLPALSWTVFKFKCLLWCVKFSFKWNTYSCCVCVCVCVCDSL